MPQIDTFTLITGLASLFGFAIQIFDLFPRYGKARQRIFLLLVGIFVGSLLRAIEPASIHLNLEVTGFTTFVTLFALVIVGFLIAAATSNDIRKRGEFFAVAGLGFVGFMFTVFLGSMMFGGIESPAFEKEKLTVHELSVLSEEAVKSKDYERAVMHLKTIESRLQTDQARRNLVEERIRSIELLEVK